MKTLAKNLKAGTVMMTDETITKIEFIPKNRNSQEDLMKVSLFSILRNKTRVAFWKARTMISHK